VGLASRTGLLAGFPGLSRVDLGRPCVAAMSCPVLSLAGFPVDCKAQGFPLLWLMSAVAPSLALSLSLGMREVLEHPSPDLRPRRQRAWWRLFQEARQQPLSSLSTPMMHASATL
jgi:hypothetical protein